jgi:hypothetical protein
MERPQAAHQPLAPPLRLRNRPKAQRPDRLGTRFVDATRVDRHLPRGGRVCCPVRASASRRFSGKSWRLWLGKSGRDPFPDEPANLNWSRSHMHSGWLGSHRAMSLGPGAEKPPGRRSETSRRTTRRAFSPPSSGARPARQISYCPRLRRAAQAGRATAGA